MVEVNLPLDLEYHRFNYTGQRELQLKKLFNLRPLKKKRKRKTKGGGQKKINWVYLLKGKLHHQ